jgi:hypothetical protein
MPAHRPEKKPRLAVCGLGFALGLYLSATVPQPAATRPNNAAPSKMKIQQGLPPRILTSFGFGGTTWAESISEPHAQSFIANRKESL